MERGRLSSVCLCHGLESLVSFFSWSQRLQLARGVRICGFVTCGLVLYGGACGSIQSRRLDLGRVSDLSLGEGAGLICLLGFRCGGVALPAGSPS
ncbi:unnamed protein product [Brassica oleracea]